MQPLRTGVFLIRNVTRLLLIGNQCGYSLRLRGAEASDLRQSTWDNRLTRYAGELPTLSSNSE